MGAVLMPVRHHYKAATMHEILASPNGGLAKNMFKRAVKVQAKAKQNLSRPPTRIKTGELRASITIQGYLYRGYPAFRVGSPLKYARYVHDGTGIYGPRHHLIEPTHAKALRWQGNTGEFVFAKHVKGMPPNPFMKDALPAAKL
jgi:HK97 gp10 family phage protein